MVDMLRKSDKSVPETESVANETLSKNKDPNKNNNVTPSAAFFFMMLSKILLFLMKLLMLMKMLI